MGLKKFEVDGHQVVITRNDWTGLFCVFIDGILREAEESLLTKAKFSLTLSSGSRMEIQDGWFGITVTVNDKPFSPAGK